MDTSPPTSSADFSVDVSQHFAAAFATPVAGPAYGRGFRAAASVILVLLAVGALRAAWVPGEATRMSWSTLAWLMMLPTAMVYLLWRATTTLDRQGIHQTGVLDRHVAWEDVASARVVRLGLSTRLLVRLHNGRLRFFHAGSTPLRAAFELVAARSGKQTR